MSTIFNYSDYNLVKGQHTLGTGMFMKKNAYVPEDRNDIESGTILGKNFCLLLNLFAMYEKNIRS